METGRKQGMLKYLSLNVLRQKRLDVIKMKTVWSCLGQRNSYLNVLTVQQNHPNIRPEVFREQQGRSQKKKKKNYRLLHY